MNTIEDDRRGTRSRMQFDVREDDLASAQTRELLALHLAGMHANSPPGTVFALDLSGLQSPEVTVWTAWSAGQIAAVGALKLLSTDGAELKSMRTAPRFIRRGAASAILDKIINVARTRGIVRMSLETGNAPEFQPALAFYRARGFRNGAAFSDYEPNGFSEFLHLDLSWEGGQSPSKSGGYPATLGIVTKQE